jgi:hypothetical protein
MHPIQPELDDKPIPNNTHVMLSQLSIYLYFFFIALPTFNTSAYGILLLASTQTRWTTIILTTLIPISIAQNIRQALL